MIWVFLWPARTSKNTKLWWWRSEKFTFFSYFTIAPFTGHSKNNALIDYLKKRLKTASKSLLKFSIHLLSTRYTLFWAQNTNKFITVITSEILVALRKNFTRHFYTARSNMYQIAVQFSSRIRIRQIILFSFSLANRPRAFAQSYKRTTCKMYLWRYVFNILVMTPL